MSAAKRRCCEVGEVGARLAALEQQTAAADARLQALETTAQRDLADFRLDALEKSALRAAV